MAFTIKSKSSLEGFIGFLTKNGFEPQKVSETEMSVEVEGEEQVSAFETAVAVYIAYLLFVKTVKESLDVLPVNDDYKARFMDEAIGYFTRTPYWKGLTLILVSDYFRNMKILNVDSFMLFNMKGFKKEIQEYVKNVTTADAEDEIVDDMKEIGIQDMFAEVRERLTKMKVDLSQYEKIHMRGKGNRLVFQTESGTVLNEEYLANLLGGMLRIEIHGASEPWQEDIMLFPTLVMIFPVKTMVVHQNVIPEAKESIERVKNMFPQGTPVIVEYCGGCDRCDE